MGPPPQPECCHESAGTREHARCPRAAILARAAGGDPEGRRGSGCRQRRRRSTAARRIYDWRIKDARRGTESRSAAGGGAQDEVERDEQHELILALWRQQPGMGRSQMWSLLKRRAFAASGSTVRAVMEEAAYVHPKLRRKEHTGHYEAVRPLQLVHLDSTSTRQR